MDIAVVRALIAAIFYNADRRSPLSAERERAKEGPEPYLLQAQALLTASYDKVRFPHPAKDIRELSESMVMSPIVSDTLNPG